MSKKMKLSRGLISLKNRYGFILLSMDMMFYAIPCSVVCLRIVESLFYTFVKNA